MYMEYEEGKVSERLFLLKDGRSLIIVVFYNIIGSTDVDSGETVQCKLYLAKSKTSLKANNTRLK